jgi:hypothetical protein
MQLHTVRYLAFSGDLAASDSCVSSCQSSSFDPFFSFGNLGPSQLIEQFATPAELERYAAIQSTAFRTVPKSVASFIQHWLETKEKYIEIQNYLKDDFAQPETSIFKVIEGMISWMIRSAEQDAHMALHELVEACNKAYTYGKEPKFNLILHQFQTILSRGNAIIGRLYRSHSISKVTGDSLRLKLFAIEEESDALELMVLPSQSDNPEDDFAAELFKGVGLGYEPAYLQATAEDRSRCHNTTVVSMQALICLKHHLKGIVLWEEANDTYSIRLAHHPGNLSGIEAWLLGNFSDACSYVSQQSTSEFPSMRDENYLALGLLVELQQLVTKL